MSSNIVILGIFVADASYRAERQPLIGETIIGNSFSLGPGGKGSNQAVAAAMAGGNVYFISRLGRDPFADMAHTLWEKSGVKPIIIEDLESYTGAACIFIEEKTGNNAIIVNPGAAGRISEKDIKDKSDVIAKSNVFVTQLEQPIGAAKKALEIAKSANSTTILNPAPAIPLNSRILSMCDFVTPNEIETETITEIKVKTVRDAEKAAKILLEKDCGAVIITLGENGAFYFDGTSSQHVPAYFAGPVVETTGAGDAFNGGFAAAIGNGAEPLEAVKFGCATAAISVTRSGTASSMPCLKEIRNLLSEQ